MAELVQLLYIWGVFISYSCDSKSDAAMRSIGDYQREPCPNRRTCRISVDAGKSPLSEGAAPAAEPSSSGRCDVLDSGDKFLIATSEQPLCAMHRNSWLEVSKANFKHEKWAPLCSG